MDKQRIFVVGVGMTKFIKPREGNPDYPVMAAQATHRALRDSNLNFKNIQAAAIGYVFGDSTCGQRLMSPNQSPLLSWHVRHPDLQHQQQLCNWLISPAHGCEAYLREYL